MTLLTEWKKKATWKYQFIMCPYYENEYGHIDIDLAAMIWKKRNNLELDINSVAGFKHLKFYDPDRTQGFKFGKTVFDLDTLDKLSDLLINALKEYFRKCWDPNIFHLIFCSEGTDSRILSLTLKEMEEDEGFDLGELLFLCHKDEIPIFKTAMRYQGWDESQYHAYKEDQLQDVDYYDWGNFDHNMNGFLAPRLDFYTSVLDQMALESKDVALVTGVINDTLFMYPSTSGKSSFTEHWGYKELDLEIFKQFTHSYRPYYLEQHVNWKDILYPFIYYPYLDVCFQIPKKFFVRRPGLYDKKHFTVDVIRYNTIKRLGNKTPVYCGAHNYNMSFSYEKRFLINLNWQSSKLYNDFPEIKLYNPGSNMPDNDLSTKLYGLATCYEVAMNGN